MNTLDPNPPALVCADDSLDTFAARIYSAYAAGMEATRKGLTYFRQIGGT